MDESCFNGSSCLTPFAKNRAATGPLHEAHHENFGERSELCPGLRVPIKTASRDSGQKQIGESDQGGANAGGNQDVVGPEVALNVKLVFPGHYRGLGQWNIGVCEVVHIRRDFFTAP